MTTCAGREGLLSRANDEPAFEQLRAACLEGRTQQALQCVSEIAARQLSTLKELTAYLPGLLEFAEQRFRHGQAVITEKIMVALRERNQSPLLALLEEKLESQYRPLHDILIDFKASGYDWVLTAYGPAQLRDCQLQLAESQKAGFAKWEEMAVEDHVRQAAYLFALHLGRTHVLDEPERYRFVLDPCGTGGVMAKSGSLTQPVKFHERVPGAYDFTFGRSDFPAYCAHCASWNGIAATDWFGHPQWAFEPWKKPGDPCGFSIYKNPHDIPESRYLELGLKRPQHLSRSRRGTPISGNELVELGTLPSDRLRQAVLNSDWSRADELASALAKEYVLMVKGLRLVLEAFAAYNASLFERRQREAFAPIPQTSLVDVPGRVQDVEARHRALMVTTRRLLFRAIEYLRDVFGEEAVRDCYVQLGRSALGRQPAEVLQG